MKTTKKGDKFEAQVLDSIKEMISEDRFFLKKDCCRVYAKKEYYSKDRGTDIIFDIAIESYLPGEESYSMLVLIECKNYNHPVPVDDVEEFYSKIQQISGANVKGIIAANSSFQSGAFSFSKSKGLGLVRYYDRSTLKWVLTRSPSSLVAHRRGETRIAQAGLTGYSFVSDYYDFYCYSNEHYTNSFNLCLSHLLIDNSPDFHQKYSATINHEKERSFVSYKTKNQIESVADAVLKKVSYSTGGVPLELICDYLGKEKGLRVLYHQKNELGAGVLGKISFDPLEIAIYSSDDETMARGRYTLAHELGHYFLGHEKLMKEEWFNEDDFAPERTMQIGVKDIVKMEWQANYFASSLLLPKTVFIPDFLVIADRIGIKDHGFGYIYLDDQPCNRTIFYTVTSELMRIYNVSSAVIKLRLKKFGFLKEPDYRLKSLF
jgi:Zn-dependent peptidase ImmA (M78 family)